VSWDDALDKVAQGWRAIIDEHGPDAVALYVSGQLLTEDYYVANKLMKGYIGSANIDTNSRLCMSSAVAGHKRAFGEDLVPAVLRRPGTGRHGGAGRLEHRMVPSDPVPAHLKRQGSAARDEAGGDRSAPHRDLRDGRSAPAGQAGTDVWLFNGLLSYLSRIGAVDRRFYRIAHTNGFDAALAANRLLHRATRGGGEDLPHRPADAAGVLRVFASTASVVTAYSQGVNQSSAGTDKVNSIINCHLLTGRIGKPGMGPFSITGQPNAMGGREVGGLANMLAAHMELEREDHRDVVQTSGNRRPWPTRAA
jgi:assimilatory nitrate reductase catalytic subunit